MKKFLTACLAAVMSLTVLLSGCSLFKGENGVDGKDGKDGKDVSIYEIYNAAKTIEGNEDMTFDEFLKEYLSYTNEKLDLTTKINYSLRSSVSIITTFNYNETGYVKNLVTGRFNSIGTVSYQSVYVGSGVIVEMGDEYSYVVTNCHVIYSDSSVTPVCNNVRLYTYGQDTDGVNYDINSYYVYEGANHVYYEYEENTVDKLITTRVENDISGISATVVGASINYDIALLKVKTSDITDKNDKAMPAVFDENDDSVIGETVYAVGFPGGEGMSATLGIISKECDTSYYSLKDDEEDYVAYRVLRTDATINGGNSGGALYNDKGLIVGIICSTSKEYTGMSYALPASNVKRLWRLMRDNQSSFDSSVKTPEVSRRYLAASYEAKTTGMSWDSETERATVWEKVVLTGVADAFPLDKDEVVTHITIKNGDTVIENKDVTRAYYLDDLMLSYRSGYTVYLTTTKHTTPVAVTTQNTPYGA